jgi:hypothetical protein
MEHDVSLGGRFHNLVIAAALCLTPSTLQAQTTPAGSVTVNATSGEWHGGWLTVGGASTTLLGDCTDCAGDHYLHSGSFMAGAGMALNPRADFGGEYMWAPATLTTGDHLKMSYLMATAQFRPWRTKGFFLKASSGMAFLRNWLKTVDEKADTPLRSKAFALGIGTGWEWRTRGRLGAQAYATLHAAALGDLETSERTIQNVMANVWSVGGAITIR